MLFSFTDIQDSESGLAMLEEFYRSIYVAGFPDPDERESLENMRRYLKLRSNGWYGQNNYHVVIAKDGDEIIGGAICDFLSEPNVGVIEFLLVAESHRGTGVGRALHDNSMQCLQRDSERIGSEGLAGIVIEMNDPYRVSIHSDNMDPFQRAVIWGKWGYKVIKFKYVQPALSESQSAVDYLLLCMNPLQARFQTSVPASMVRQTIFGYFKWAMRIDVPDKNVNYQDMAKSLESSAVVPMTLLNVYIGEDPERPFEIHPVTSDRDPQFPNLMSVYLRSFRQGQTAIGASAFARTLDRVGSGKPGLHYHLWGVRLTQSTSLSGITSFYTVSEVGFGGYIALDFPLKGTGRCGLILARIEAQMVRDQPGIRGWYIECEPDSESVDSFERYGFRKVECCYLQPSLNAFDPNISTKSFGPELALMYKPLSFGYASSIRPEERLVSDLCDILKNVYCIDEPKDTPTMRSLIRSPSESQ